MGTRIRIRVGFTCLILVHLNLVLADQHVILDTTKESMLDWTRFPYGPSSPTPGWVEESFTNFEKSINWRSYVVCDVSYNNVNNWLWTPFITRGNANRLYIEIKFSLRNCDLFPGNAVQCKETFSLLYYEFDVATREPPPWETESYKLIDQIAADMGRFTDTNEVIINTEVRSIDVTKKGVYFAFRDQGACLSLLAVKVYYLTCPETTVGFAYYPETPTGAEVTSVEKIAGKCVDNAVAISDPYNLCKGEGTWAYPSGRCACMAGYRADEATQTCTPCSVGSFKPTSGEGKCLICPPQSQALFAGSVECRCNDNYYRAQGDPRTSGCTRPPSAPRNITRRYLDQSTLMLTWDPPLDEGGRTDTQYKVECDFCSSLVTIAPSSPSQQTTATLSNLQQGSTYTIRIFALNGVSNMSNKSDNLAEVSVSTGSGAPSVVSNLMISDKKTSQLSLSWIPPSDPLLDIDLYEVKYFVRGQKSNTSNVVITKKELIEIPGLVEGTEYGLQVRARTNRGWGEFSSPLYATTQSEVDPVFMGADNDPLPGRVAIGVVVSIILLVTIVIVSIFMYRRNSSHRWTKQKHPERDCDSSLDYRCMDPHFVTSIGESLPIVQTHSGTTIPPGLYNPFSMHKTYIDPHTYEDPNIAVKQFAKEIDARFIGIEAIIGGGEFGDVCRGRLSLPDRNDMLVAIKTLKPGSSEKARNDFLTEASIMGQFEHPNVIFLQGVVTKSNPIMIITEFMENGSLDTFLRANDGKFQVMQLVGMMRGIAYGMQYLAEMNFVHRDLAARNVLVNSQLVCKIADFGLSREISDANMDGAYTTRGGKIPVRWTAPEAIAFRKFTSASDIWSFGIVMWEVMSYGERPYWTWSNQDVIKAIEKGYRLPAPMDCPEAIHQLMLDCWQKERSHRPSFPSTVKTLDKLICCPETLKKIAKSPMHNPYATNVPDYSSFESVDEWLTFIKMNRYADNFAQAGINSLGDVSKLSLQQLVELGITLVGHQKKIMSSIHAMRAQMSVNISEGFLV